MASEFLRQVASGQVPDTNSIDSLSNREREVFELLGRGMTNQQVARQLGLSRKIIETHRKNRKMTLAVQNRAQLSRQAFQWGLKSGMRTPAGSHPVESLDE
jgi:DNA-binding NarL/FixJ family response regulator